MAAGFFGGLYLLVQNFPRLHVHTIFSSIPFLRILLLEESCVQVQALQQRVPGPRLAVLATISQMLIACQAPAMLNYVTCHFKADKGQTGMVSHGSA